MSQADLFTSLCKKCFIRLRHPSKKYIQKIVLSEEKCECEHCGRTDYIVDYVED